MCVYLCADVPEPGVGLSEESGGRPEAGGRGAGLSGAEQAGGLRSRRVPKETLRTERRSEPEQR